MSVPRVLVTGANGFIGGAVIRALRERGQFNVVAAVRRATAVQSNTGYRQCVIDLDHKKGWQESLSGVDILIHCAGKAHVPAAAEVVQSTNVAGTLHLAQQAANCGVRRFVFLSSIAVYGQPVGGKISGSAGEPVPCGAYGRSKLEAEKGLVDLLRGQSMELVIIRPPLVYGPSAPGNFGKLVKWIERGWPLPFLSISNQRSFIGIDNLTDFILHCAKNPVAAGKTLLIADGEDISTPDLVRHLANHMQRPARLFRLPQGCLNLAGALTGQSQRLRRLSESLQVDATQSRSLIGWTPSVSLDEGLRRAVAQSRE